MKNFSIVMGTILSIIVAVAVTLFFVMSSTSDKLVCKSEIGNITIMYKDDELVTYTCDDTIDYDFDDEEMLAKELGMDAYLLQYAELFNRQTGGSCSYRNN